MSPVEAEHAELLKLDRLEWLRDTMALLYAGELGQPGSVPDLAVMALHSSTQSWIKSVLKARPSGLANPRPVTALSAT